MPKIIKINRVYVSNQAKRSHFLGQRVHVQYKYDCVAIGLLIPDIFVTAQTALYHCTIAITAHFVYHCTVSNLF